MHIVLSKIFSILKLSKLFIPGIITVVLVALFSYLGVFIEEEPLLMLKGGFNNKYVFLSFFVLSNLLAWTLSQLIFKYSSILNGKVSILFITILSVAFELTALCAYYFSVVYILTGLIPWRIDIAFSDQLAKEIMQIVLFLAGTVILVGLCSNMILTFINQKNASKRQIDNQPEESSKNASEKSSSETVSSFENSISI